MEARDRDLLREAGSGNQQHAQLRRLQFGGDESLRGLVQRHFAPMPGHRAPPSASMLLAGLTSSSAVGAQPSFSSLLPAPAPAAGGGAAYPLLYAGGSRPKGSLAATGVRPRLATGEQPPAALVAKTETTGLSLPSIMPPLQQHNSFAATSSRLIQPLEAAAAGGGPGHHRVLQVVARLPGLGTVSVGVEAQAKVQDLIMLVETHVWANYSIPVEVRKLSDLHGIDLAPSYEVGKLLDGDDHTVQAHYHRLDNQPPILPPLASAPLVPDLATSSSSASSSTQPGQADRTTIALHPSSSSLASSLSSGSSSASSSVPPASSSSSPSKPVQLSFVEPPPTKILQNKEFCFTVAFSFPGGQEGAEVWRVPAASKLLKMTVASEAGEAVPEQNFSVRTMAMEGKDMIGLFGRLRVNSYYGRKRYLIRVHCTDPASWRSNVLTSDPITVLSKKCKHRSKRSKEGLVAGEDDAEETESPPDEEPQPPTSSSSSSVP